MNHSDSQFFPHSFEGQDVVPADTESDVMLRDVFQDSKFRPHCRTEGKILQRNINDLVGEADEGKYINEVAETTDFSLPRDHVCIFRCSEREREVEKYFCSKLSLPLALMTSVCQKLMIRKFNVFSRIRISWTSGKNAIIG